jgi:hypothetical protein
MTPFPDNSFTAFPKYTPNSVAVPKRLVNLYDRSAQTEFLSMPSPYPVRAQAIPAMLALTSLPCAPLAFR